MTQGQWLRITGENPSIGQGGRLLDRASPIALLHPVEDVSWNECMQVCRWLGLKLPTEAEWEYGARAGTNTGWWTGDELGLLEGAANLADQTSKRIGTSWAGLEVWDVDDGYPLHAPVQQFLANPFGLHNVHGNVWEWCLDGYDGGSYAPDPAVDPIGTHEGRVYRAFRGRGFLSGSLTSSPGGDSRVAARGNGSPTESDHDLGLRPARSIAD